MEEGRDTPKMPDTALTDTPNSSPWPQSPVLRRLLPIFYIFSAVQFVYAYAAVALCYVRLDRYLAGTANLPFQRRVLVMFVLKLLLRLHLPLGTSGPNTLDGVPRLLLVLIDVTGFGAAAWFCRAAVKCFATVRTYPSVSAYGGTPWYLSTAASPAL